MEMDDNKRRRNMILYVLIAFVVYLVLSTVLFPNIGHTQQITKTDYSTLSKRSIRRVSTRSSTHGRLLDLLHQEGRGREHRL